MSLDVTNRSESLLHSLREAEIEAPSESNHTLALRLSTGTGRHEKSTRFERSPVSSSVVDRAHGAAWSTGNKSSTARADVPPPSRRGEDKPSVWKPPLGAIAGFVESDTRTAALAGGDAGCANAFRRTSTGIFGSVS